MELLGLNKEQINKYAKLDGQNFGIRMPVAIVPMASIPTKVAIPLKSNKYSYGPWRTTSYTPGGKVRFEKDESLVPWNFGGYLGMDYAAEARINSVYTGMYAGELGSVEEAGAPTVNLGDLIKAGGPNVTSINISYGADGIKTTYQMQTYTPKFGAFSLQNSERIRRININAQKIRKQLKSKIRTYLGLNHRVLAPYLHDTFGAAKRFGGSPHEGLVAYSDGEFTTVSTDIAQHFSAKFGGNLYKGSNEEEFKKMGAVGLEAIFRPYLVDKDADAKYMPRFVDPTQSGVPNATTLNPFKSGHDIDIVLKGTDSYEEYILRNANRGNPSGLRPVGLKSPMVLVGWGYDIAGNPVPSGSNGFLEGYLKKPETWKAGPLDVRWDESRGVWVGGSTIQLAELQSAIYASSSSEVDGEILIDNNGIKRTGTKVKIRSPLRGVSLGSGTRCWIIPWGSNKYSILSTES